jgi:hypothetical protein
MMDRCSIHGCKRSHYARGYCAGHYQRWKRNSPIEGNLQTNKETIEKFIEEALLSDTDDCIIWPYGRSAGYAQISRSNKFYNKSGRLHRTICKIKHGPPPPNKPQSAHSCATRLCINWKHLSWQSNMENSNNPITITRMSISAKRRCENARQIQTSRNRLAASTS